MTIYFLGCDMGGWHGNNDAYAVCKFDNGQWTAHATRRGVLFSPFDASLHQLLTGVANSQNDCVVVGIDGALGWPRWFSKLVREASVGGFTNAVRYDPRNVPNVPHAGSINNPFLYRQTEQFIHEQYPAVLPFTAPGAWFGNNSTKAQVLATGVSSYFKPTDVCFPPFLTHLADAHRPRPSVAKATIIEVYPSASWECPSFLNLLWPDSNSGTRVSALQLHNDEDDAKICALTAVCYAVYVGLLPAGALQCPPVAPPPVNTTPSAIGRRYVPKTIRQEGWIFVPV